MSKQRIAIVALFQALGTILYVLVVVGLLFTIGNNVEFPDHPFLEYMAPVSALLLLIVSASITGSMVFGYSVILALRQELQQAILLASATVAWMVLFMLVGLVIFLVTAGQAPK